MFGRSFVQNVKSFNVGWHLPVSPTRHIELFFCRRAEDSVAKADKAWMRVHEENIAEV